MQAKNDRSLFTSIIAVSLILVGLFAFLFNLGYNKFIKQAIITEQVSDFNQYKDLVSHQYEEIENTHLDVDKINSYISHELKNSLAVLKTKQVNSEEFEDYIDELNKQIDDIGALTANKLTNVTDVDVLIVLATLADNYQPAVEFDFADGEYNIVGNSTLLTRAFDNVINNAFKYGADKVWIDAYNFSGNVIIKISNNGKMISPAERDKIFDFKYRTPELKADGSGIGLALVRNIIELHNGGIYVESNQLETSFYFSFKLG